MEEEVVKELIIKLLDYYKEQIKSGKCAMTTMMAFYRILVEHLDVVGTTKDFSQFFNVPESTIRSEIARKMVEKPTRRVFYKFNSFLKIVPRSWLRKSQLG